MRSPLRIATTVLGAFFTRIALLLSIAVADPVTTGIVAGIVW